MQKIAYNNVIKFGTLTLGGVSGANSVQNISRNKTEGSAKQLLNNIVTFIPIPGKAKEDIITIRGKLFGTNKDSDRTTLLNYDNGQARRYEDGIVSADFIIVPGTLVFDDSSERTQEYPYIMTIRQA